MHHLLAVTTHRYALLVVGAACHVERVHLSFSLVRRLLHLQALDEVVGSWLATCTLSLAVISCLHLSLVHALFLRRIARRSRVVLERLTSRRYHFGRIYFVIISSTLVIFVGNDGLVRLKVLANPLVDCRLAQLIIVLRRCLHFDHVFQLHISLAVSCEFLIVELVVDVYTRVASLALVLQRRLVNVSCSRSVCLLTSRLLVRSRTTSYDVHAVVFQVIAGLTQIFIAYPVNAACNR